MSYLRRIAASFSATGLIFGLEFLCASLTPSLLPRVSVAQEIPSGVVFSAGYSIGKAGYIDAWIEVSQPKNWSAVGTAKLKTYFIGFNPRPL